jgi:glyoxylase-like metal-dependent hydrolase (beta-lactamase superfamily II)
MRTHIAVGIAAAMVLAGCALGGPPTVDRWASPNPGSVNAYWIEARDGLVIIDAGRNVTGGRQIVDKISQTGQRIAAILLTHPHPDHVGGLGVLHEEFSDTPIYASEATDKWMRDDPLGFYPLARQADPDYPSTLTYATETFAPDAEIHVAGITLHTAEFGPGESTTATVYYEQSTRALFAGDVTGNHVTPALIEGTSCGWLTNLATLSERFGDADTVYPGHGDPGPASQQIGEQRDYLKRFRQSVRPAISPDSDAGTNVTDHETTHIAAVLEKAFRGYPRVASLPNLQQLNIAAVGRELVAEATATVPPECT